MTIAKEYMSYDRIASDQLVNYNIPVVLQIWGANSLCTKAELLYQSKPVDNYSVWENYYIEFTPTQDHTFLLFEAYYDTGRKFPYNGHLLMDRISSIERVE